MVSTLFSSYSTLFTQTAGTATSMKSRAGQATSLSSRLEENDQEKTDAISKKLTEARNASAQLRTAEVDQNAERKAAAMEKIQRIKEQLKMLRMLGAGDPKALARQAARLSRELAAAVKEYAAANGGKAPDGISTAAPATSAPAQQEQGAQAENSHSATVESPEVASQSAPSPGAAATPEDRTGRENTNTADGNAAEAETEAEAEAEAKPNSPEEIREKQQEEREEERLSPAVSGPAGKRTTGISFTDPHSTFKDLVRSAEDEIKKILELAKSQLSQREDRNLRRDMELSEKSLREIEQILSALTGPGISSSATPSVTSAAAPVDILA